MYQVFFKKNWLVIDNVALHIIQFNVYLVRFGNCLRVTFTQQPLRRFAKQWLNRMQGGANVNFARYQ